jgi:hypothetical protein
MATIVIAVACADRAQAQWADDPTQTLAVSDQAGEQAQPKIRATSDGGCYVVWFDSLGTGFDVYLQRLDAAGYEQWAHNGILIAERSFSSTEDYGFDVDATGNAMLAFRDDRGGGVRVTAARVSPDGTLVWGADGVQLTGPGDEVLSPRIAATTDGGCVVGWTQINPSDGTTMVGLQKLDADGLPLWGDGVTLADTSGGNFMLADLKGSDDGGAIASWVRQGPDFWSPRHLWAQKLSSTGASLWDPDHVVVYDGGTLQFGNFPPFVSDGAGGAVFAWYQIVGSTIDCAAQRILASGNEWLPHNGVTGSTAPRQRTSQSVSFNTATEEIFLFWEEELSGPYPEFAVYGQKIVAERGREWTDQGKEVLPFSEGQKSPIRSLPCGDGAMVFFSNTLNSDNVLYASRLDGAGEFVWSPSLLLAGASYPFRLDPALSSNEIALLTWTAGDIYAQNINPDGTLGGGGAIAGDLDGDGDVDLADLATMLAAYDTCVGDPGYDPVADLDGDDCVGLADLAALLSNYGA